MLLPKAQPMGQVRSVAGSEAGHGNPDALAISKLLWCQKKSYYNLSGNRDGLSAFMRLAGVGHTHLFVAGDQRIAWKLLERYPPVTLPTSRCVCPTPPIA